MNPIVLYKKIREIVPSVPGLISWEPVGSQVTCDPPPVENTDCDVLLYVSDLSAARAFLSDWEDCRAAYETNGLETIANEPFAAFRKEELNLIVTDDERWFVRFMNATILCTKLNIMQKDLRILLFSVVRGGKDLYPES